MQEDPNDLNTSTGSVVEERPLKKAGGKRGSGVSFKSQSYLKHSSSKNIAESGSKPKSNRDSMRSIISAKGSILGIDKPVISLYPRHSILVTSRPSQNSTSRRYSNVSQHGNSRGSLRSMRKSSVTNNSQPVLQNEAGQQEVHSDYNEYLMLQHRHASSNFIQQMDSNEMVWEAPQSSVKMLGEHMMGGKIGKGAFGKVKEGICTDNLQRIAIKIVSKKRVKKMADTIVREIKLLRMLKHENVVTLIDVFAKVEDENSATGIFPWFLTIEEEPIVWIFEDGTEEEKIVKILKWYIILEYCPCSLQTILDHSENHKIQEYDCHDYFIQLINGLSYLHSQSVVHRDIKPGNLLITTDRVLKIADFGTAEEFDRFSGGPMLCNSFAGTHHFLAPEVIEDNSSNGYDGTKVDIWAAGVVLYYMLAGKLPFEFNDEPNVLELHEKITAGKFEMVPEANVSVANLIINILQVDPNERYTIEQIENHYWTLSDIKQHSKPHNIIAYSTEVLSPETAQNTAHEIPCETTMIPFMEEMYQKELEQDLSQSGLVNDWCKHDEDESDIVYCD